MISKHSDLIGICIPTYNRADILSRNLENLIEQIKNFSVPIYISDNDSPDNTKEVVENAKGKYEYIYYNKNDTNIGSDLNFQKALLLTETKYAWLLGDDDTIIRDFDKIYEILDKNDYDALIFGPPKTIGKKPVYFDANDMLIDLAGSMTWISGLIISKRIIAKMNFNRYVGSSFVHTGALLEALCNPDLKVYNYATKLSNRVVDSMQKYYSGFAEVAFETFTKNWMGMICSLPYQYAFEAKIKAIANLPTAPFRIVTLIMYRAWGVFDYNILNKQVRIIKAIGNRYYYKMMIVALMPKFIAKGIINLGKYIRKTLYGF